MIDLQMHDDIAEVALDRPEAYNAFNLEMVQSLADTLTKIAPDPGVAGVVITGRGKAFCAGGDLRWALNHWPEHPGRAFHTLAARFHRAVTEIRRMEKPVVAAVNGVAAGGGFSLALACDFRVMAQSAVLRQAYTSNGLCIDGGGTHTLPRLVGFARAMEIAAFDAPIDAEKAFAWGLATELAEDGRALDAALEMVRRVAGGAFHAFSRVKRLMTDTYGNCLEYQLEREREALGACADHPEGREGLAAFSEKRNPRFR